MEMVHQTKKRRNVESDAELSERPVISIRAANKKKIGLSEHTRRTPLGSETDPDGGIAGAIGTLVSYIVYFYAALAAADVLGIAILSESLSEIGAFLPVIFSAAIILVIGFIIGRKLGEIIAGL